MYKIKIQAHRKLRHLKNYKTLDANEIPSEFKNFALQDEEQAVGIYKTTVNGLVDAIFLTTNTIYIKDGEIYHSLPYAELDSIKSPPLELKHSANSLDLCLRSGEILSVPIRGGQGKLRDVWAFVHFFHKLTS